MASGPGSQVAMASRRKLPLYISSTTVTNASTTITLSAHINKILLIQATGKIHINAETATTAHPYLTADEKQEFQVTKDRSTVYAIAASGASFSLIISETGD